MTNTSASGGYLAPEIAPAPLQGQDLSAFLQQVVVGITGLDGTLVRPRWQPVPPIIPDAYTAWCAFGIVNRDRDSYAYVGHETNSSSGDDQFQRHETLNTLASFYDTGQGGLADYYLDLLDDGLQIGQNREVLQLNGMGIKSTGSPVVVPSLVKERWLYRVDLPIAIRRQIRRVYPVLDLLSAQIFVTAGSVSISLVVEN